MPWENGSVCGSKNATLWREVMTRDKIRSNHKRNWWKIKRIKKSCNMEGINNGLKPAVNLKKEKNIV